MSTLVDEIRAIIDLAVDDASDVPTWHLIELLREFFADDGEATS